MDLRPALAELFAHKTQTVIARELTALGLKCDQTKVSAWLNGRAPTLDQLDVIERWAGKPRGWVLGRAGYPTAADVRPISSPSGGTELSARLAVRVATLERKVSGLIRLAEKSVGVSEVATAILAQDDPTAEAAQQ